jgi:hypothetical protein
VGRLLQRVPAPGERARVAQGIERQYGFAQLEIAGSTPAPRTFKASTMDKIEILLGILILLYSCGVIAACLWIVM